MAKHKKAHGEHKFEVKDTDVELLADWYISAAHTIGIVPTYGEICRRVYKELKTKYPIDRCKKETQNGIYKFACDFIYTKYIWR